MAEPEKFDVHQIRSRWPDGGELFVRLEEVRPILKREAALREALEEQKTGAEWRRENEPENWEGCDDEAFDRMEAALDEKGA